MEGRKFGSLLCHHLELELAYTKSDLSSPVFFDLSSALTFPLAAILL